VRDTAATVATGDLFKLSRNKQPDDTSGSRLLLPHGSNSRVIEGETRTRVCEPSVFHLPVVYDDLQQVAKDLQKLFTKSNPAPQTNPSSFMAFLNQFIATKWIPKVKARAQHFLNLKYRSPNNSWRLPVPSDTSYQPPSIDSLLFISEELSEMIQKMPDHTSVLIGVLDTTVLKWLDDCAAIVKDIREPTLNHRQIVQSVAFSELLAVFQKYELYQRAKRDGPIPFQQARATPVSKTPISNTPRELIREKEYEMEKEYYDPDAWPGANGAKGLLMDKSRVAMLGYINSACDYIAHFLHTVGSRVNRRTTSFGLSGSSSNGSTGASSGVGEALQATSWKCSSLADECLFFLRREIRLHCFYYLTQLVSQRFDLNEEQVTMAQDSVLCFNINLSSMEHALQPYLSSDKMALVFDGIDALLASILITDLQHMQGATLTKGGVQQMLLNVGALHQGLTGILYSYPSISRSGVHFDHAKRYYQLLLLPETQLELFLLDNRRAYSSDAYKSLWRVETPHRVLSKGSLNKLDSLLR
jgi:exocyst complex component 4